MQSRPDLAEMVCPPYVFASAWVVFAETRPTRDESGLSGYLSDVPDVIPISTNPCKSMFEAVLVQRHFRFACLNIVRFPHPAHPATVRLPPHAFV